jgi:hypothetical protein
MGPGDLNIKLWVGSYGLLPGRIKHEKFEVPILFPD